MTLANHLICKVTIPHASGLPGDATTNTFHFRKPGALSVGDAAAAAAVLVEDFYTTVPDANGVSPTPSRAVSEWIGSGMSRTTDAVTIDVYDGSVAPPRVPVLTANFTLDAALGTAQLPNEVALVVSFRQLVTGVIPARSRGRLYIGPLYSGASVSTPASGWVRPDRTSDPNPVGTLAAAMATLIQDSYDGYIADIKPAFVVFSPTDNITRLPTECYVDNEFDTQRRRGGAATARTLVTGLGA